MEKRLFKKHPGKTLSEHLQRRTQRWEKKTHSEIFWNFFFPHETLETKNEEC